VREPQRFASANCRRARPHTPIRTGGRPCCDLAGGSRPWTSYAGLDQTAEKCSVPAVCVRVRVYITNHRTSRGLKSRWASGWKIGVPEVVLMTGGYFTRNR